MYRYRELVEEDVYTNQLATLGYSEEDLDAALDALGWAIAANAEYYKVVPGTEHLRVAKTDAYSRGRVWVPPLKVWFKILDENQVLLKAITISPDDESF
jgi:hypothetical protein